MRELADDQTLGERVRLVAAQEGWGIPVWAFDDLSDFYRAVDYLLVPSRIEEAQCLSWRHSHLEQWP